MRLTTIATAILVMLLLLAVPGVSTRYTSTAEGRTMEVDDDQLAASSSSVHSPASSAGFHRLRQRMHRRRHKTHHRRPLGAEPESAAAAAPDSDHNNNSIEGADKVVDQLDELFEMKAAAEEVVQRSAKGLARRERNEELCAAERKSVELNNDEWEYDPPFILHIRCRAVHEYENGKTATLQEQSCVHGLLRCVQRYSEVMTARRSSSSSSSKSVTGWHPHVIRSVPSGCDCMWPVDKYGHLEL